MEAWQFRRAAAADVPAIMVLERATFVTGEVLHIDGGWATGR